ncbi:MAG: polysaccharide deacetylase family protein [Clostridia bacterium]|nr:polysaccharide deacetylase family protein [Clostridia bacterium]
MFGETNTYYIDNRGGKVMYLTFDEGYENGYTAQILDVLKEKNVQAAFFITGPYLSRETELVDRMVNEGHIVGNHTVNHPNLAKSELSVVASELKGLNDAFSEKYGKDMIYMRPPEGEYSEKLLCFTGDMGYKTILWSFAYKDWDVKIQKGAEYAFNQVTPYFHDGAILLLHAVSSDNAGALGKIIDCAREQGYEFKSLDYLTE